MTHNNRDVFKARCHFDKTWNYDNLKTSEKALKVI